MASELPPEGPEPRLCHLVKWPDFDGYGFNLHAEKAKTGQFIGKVDDDSPADHAGLKEGDRIIEVNGVNIANENHRQVVERIKAVPNETKLLVLDDEADNWYKERKLVVKSTQPNVKYVKTPVPRPAFGVNKEQVVKPKAENNAVVHSNGNAPHSETRSLAESSSQSSTPKTLPKRDDDSISSSRSSAASSPQLSPPEGRAQQNGSASNGGSAHSATPPLAAKTESVKTKASSDKIKAVSNGNKAPPDTANGNKAPSSATNGSKAPSSATNGSKAPTDAPNGNKASSDTPDASKNGKAEAAKSAKGAPSGELNLNMSAAQMREMLANKKKNDPKKQTMDMREKYQIVQQM